MHSSFSFVCLFSCVCVFHRILDHRWHGLLCRMLQWRRGLCWVRRTCRWARSVEFCLPLCGGLSFATEDQILKASPPPMDRKSVTSCPIQVPTHVHQYRDNHIVGYPDIMWYKQNRNRHAFPMLSLVHSVALNQS